MSTVFISEIIKAPIEQIWSFVRDFNSLDKFHPAIKLSKIEQGNPKEIGCIRHLTLESGFVREELLLLDDENFTLNYSIIENTLGLKNYIASMKLRKGSYDNETICEWSANFDVEAGINKDEMINIVGNHVFKTGYKALADKLLESSRLPCC